MVIRGAVRSHRLMIPEPSDDENKTIFCRTCSEWRHPRHACARDSSHDTAPLPVIRLRETGPSGPDVFGKHESGLNPQTRQQFPVAKFELMSHSRGTSSVFGNTRPVYYLTDDQSPEEVIETWIDINEDQLAGRGLTTENLSRALSKNRVKEAWKKLRMQRDFPVLEDPEPRNRGGGQQGKMKCPYCGEMVSRLPTHLPCEESTD